MILCILKGISPFKMHKIIFFSENLEKKLGLISKFKHILFIWPYGFPQLNQDRSRAYWHLLLIALPTSFDLQYYEKTLVKIVR